MSRTINSVFVTEEQRWIAVVGRDRVADGSFIYAVQTTGVYCRPSCASRQPNRANVSFYSNCEDAERAGYRACKRCRPNTVSTQIPAAVIRACQLIDEADEPPALNDLAAAVGLSPYYFHRLFKAVVGLTPKRFAAARRVQRLKQELLQEGTVTKAIYDAGFGSSSRCYEDVVDTLGMTPLTYKSGAAGEQIRSAVVESRLGWLLVAATARGICAIEFGDRPEDFRERLSARFPKAELVDGDTTFAAWVTQVLRFIEAPHRGLELPLDIQGTAFQHRVWKALQAIPVGSTATYAEVAIRIGSPAAVRAVARACASNSVAVAIPCHRVVGRGGKLTGYRWGVDRKRALLDQESRLETALTSIAARPR